MALAGTVIAMPVVSWAQGVASPGGAPAGAPSLADPPGAVAGGTTPALPVMPRLDNQPVPGPAAPPPGRDATMPGRPVVQAPGSSAPLAPTPSTNPLAPVDEPPTRPGAARLP